MFASKKFILLFSSIAVLILWQLLLPGYVLTLDMVFVPHPHFLASSSGYLNTFPLTYLIVFFGNIIPAWTVQKIFLLLLFFSLGYFSFTFLPTSKDKTARFFCALFYTVNPFVYERFLAGQWLLLFGYAFLPIFFHFLLEAGEKPERKNIFALFASLFAIGVFSLHIFVMCVLVMCLYFLYFFISFSLKNDCKSIRSVFISFFIAGIVFVLASSYWIIPLFLKNNSFEQRFDQNHWSAFAASGHGVVPPILNVLSLFGFWGENNTWAHQFIWPQEYTYFWVLIACSFILIFLGFLDAVRDPKTNSKILFFSLLAILSFIFSLGVSKSPFSAFNFWMYEHIEFWRGFRDSQKFSAVLALCYTVLAGFGIESFLEFLEKRKPLFIPKAKVLILCLPVFLGFFMWGGFRGQLHSVQYPNSWEKARQIMQNDISDKKTLFLPWHGYLSLEFNNNILVANPARAFFGERSIVSKNIELGELYDQETSQEYLAIDTMVRDDSNLPSDEIIQFLQKNNIQYIVLFQDLEGHDFWSYNFLSSDKLREIFHEKDLLMYEIIGG